MPLTQYRFVVTMSEGLDFKKVDSWNIVGKEVLECAKLKSTDTHDLIILRMTQYMSPQEYTTQQLILRTCKNIPRLMKESDDKTTTRK